MTKTNHAQSNNVKGLNIRTVVQEPTVLLSSEGSYLFCPLKVLLNKYARILLLARLILVMHICIFKYDKFLKMLEYAVVFVLMSTSKYAYVRYHCTYTEIRSYLLLNPIILPSYH